MIIRTSNIPFDLVEVTRMAVKFYVDRYYTKRAKDRCEEILVAFRAGGPADNLAYASCEELYNRLPNEFLIEFNNKNRDIPVRDYLITLFHEMTHIKQYAYGHLKLRHGYDIWKGERWDTEKATEDDYWAFPWEREARAIELEAYKAFVEANPKLNLERWKPTYIGRAESGWTGVPEEPL
jgi:hypothetical protein